MKIVLFLFISTVCFAQNNNLLVTYGLIFHKDETLSHESSMFKTHLDYAISKPNKFLFDLKIDSVGSSFELKNKLKVEDMTLSDNLGFVFAKYPGLIFSFKDSILKQSALLGNRVFVNSSLIKEWKITNESKNIDGYLCYKATNIDRVHNGNREFNHPIVAWYCPEIPFSHGPIGYSNLPGLILQLQVRNVVYGVLKIDFKSDQVPKYEVLENAKIISSSEEDERLKAFFED